MKKASLQKAARKSTVAGKTQPNALLKVAGQPFRNGNPVDESLVGRSGVQEKMDLHLDFGALTLGRRLLAERNVKEYGDETLFGKMALAEVAALNEVLNELDAMRVEFRKQEAAFNAQFRRRRRAGARKDGAQ